MASYRFIDDIKAENHKIKLLHAALIRFGIIVLVLGLFDFPIAKLWRVSHTHIIQYIAIALAILNSIAFLNYLRWKMVVFSTFTMTIVDLISITFLAYFTGGYHSPFLILYIVQIVGVFLLGHPIQALFTLCIGVVLGLMFFGGLAMDIIPYYDPLTISGPTFLSPLGTLTVLAIIVLFAVAMAALVFVSGRKIQSLQKEISEFQQRLKKANEELANSFKAAEALFSQYEITANKAEHFYQQLLQTEYIAYLSRSAVGLAYEIKNPLSAIISESELLFLNPKLDQKAKEGLKRIIGYSERIVSMTKELTEAIRPEKEIQFMPIDLNYLVAKCLNLLEPEAKAKKVQVTKEMDPKNPKTLGVSRQLELVVLNLLYNALDAASIDGKMIKIITRTLGDMVSITVMDNGLGIRSEHLNEIFEPFFTTRSESGALGLGLYLSKSIVKAHKGQIEVQSKPLEATVFEVLLPAYRS